jgi:hypothetical protein
MSRANVYDEAIDVGARKLMSLRSETADAP